MLAALGDALDRAERPGFVVGAALDRDGAWDDVVALAERHNALVWASPMSGRASFPESHPLFAGHLPANRERIVELLTGRDLVLVLGAPVFTYHTEGFGPYVPEGTVLWQLVNDPDMAAWAPVGNAVVASLGLGIGDLLARAAPPRRATPNGRAVPPRALPGDPIPVAYLMQTLAELRAPDSIIVEEAPSSRPTMQSYLPIHRSDTFYTCASGGLGHGLPAAVGVALGKPGKRIIALMGDGSAMYSIQALWSAAQLGLPITIVIVRNGSYQALDQFAPQFGLDHLVGSQLPDIDFVALARGHGCAGVRVERADALAAALAEALAADRPTLVEVVTA